MTVSATTVTQYYTGIFRTAPSTAVSTAYQAMADDAAALNSMLSSANVSVDPIIRLYQTAFNRLPDNAGLTAWVVPFSTGAITLQSIANGFTQSTEFTTLYPTTMSNSQFVGALYWNILQRQGEDAGIAGWVNALNSGALTRAQVLLGFSNSDEFKGNVESGVNSFLTRIAVTPVEDQGAAALYTGTLYDLAVGTEYSLTTNVDDLVGGAGRNTFIGTEATITPFDNIQGGIGNDTFKVFDVTGSAANLGLITVNNVETLTLTSTKGLYNKSADVSGWTGLTAANLTLQAAQGDEALTVGNTAAVSITSTAAAATKGAITVNGGSTVSITQNNVAVDNSGNTITVNGGAATTTVSVTQSITTGKSAKVTVTDLNAADNTKADTISAVTISGATDGVVAINSDALTSLTLVNSDQNITITNDTAGHALAIAMTDVTGGTIADAEATSVSVSVTETISTVVSAATLNVAKATALSFSGDAEVAIQLSSQATGLAISSTNTAGVIILTQLDTDVAFTGGTGDDAVTIAATTSAISMGDGSNNVTIAAGVTALGKGGTVAAGTGVDILVMDAADAATASATTTFGTAISGFDVFGINNAAADATVKINNLGASFDTADLLGVDAKKTLTLSGLASGFTLLLDDGILGAVDAQLASAGSADSINIEIGNTAAQTVAALTTSGFETINIFTEDDATTPAGTVQHKITALTDADATSIYVSGDAGLELGFTGTALTLFDASAVTLGDVKWTAGALAGAAIIEGGATGTNTITFTAATGGTITYTGGTGADVIVGKNGVANTINLGDGANSYTHAASAGVQTVTGGINADTITGGTAADIIVGGGGADVVTGGAGADSVTLSGSTAGFVLANNDTGANTATAVVTSVIATSFDVYTGIAAGMTVTTANANIITADLTLSGANLAGAANGAVFARGAYDSAAGTFSYAANGADTLLTYEVVDGGGDFEAVVLVGFVAGATTSAAAGVITLA